MMKTISKLTLLLALLSMGFSATAQEQQKKYKVYMVSNAHLDTQWRWDVKTTIDEFLYITVLQNLALLEKYPSYVFNFEGAVKYQWIKEYYPELYPKVKDYIKTGRWNISGASWDANDPNLPSPESFIRNILLAQEFYRSEFGKISKDMFLPDCFGFSYTMPTLGRHCGILGFSTQKMSWRNEPLVGDSKTPFPIGLWQGIDSSRVMVALEPGRYSWNLFPEGDLTMNESLMESAEKSPFGIAYRYYGTRLSNGLGDRGGSPWPRSVQILEEAISNGKGPIELISATSSQLYEDYYPFEDHPELPVFEGEMPLDVHAPGCYTAQAEMKRYNRRNEQLAAAAERSAVIADWLGGVPYPKDAINDAWQRFLWHQFHDDLTGTSIWQAYTYSWNDEVIAQNQFVDVIKASTGAIVSGMDTRTKGTPVVVYNPASYARRSIAEAVVELPAGAKGVSVYGPDGKEVPAQLLSIDNGHAEIIFAANVGPVGYEVYDVRPGSSRPNKNLTVTANSIENRIYKVTLDSNGDIASLVDKRNGHQLVDEGKAFRLGVITPNESDSYPAWEIYKATLDITASSVTGNVKISIAESGNLRAALKVERTFGDSKFVQYIRLTDGAADDRIDIVTEIDWATPSALLKAEFPTTVHSEKAVYDLGIGAIERATNNIRAHETFAHHWADISDGGYGVAILNDCKYGWDKPDGNTLRLTLLHTPSANKRYGDQNVLDFGRHTMTYSIVGHAGDWRQSGLVEKGEDMNQQLITFTAPKHAGKMGKSFSFVSSSTPQVALKALKKAEDGNGYIVRIYETQGRRAEGAQVVFPVGIESAAEVNGIEQTIGQARFSGNRLTVDVGSFAPKSYRITLKGPQVTIPAADNKPVPLPYNAITISSDAFKSVAKMDADCNSYSAELMPETIVHGAVEYKRGEADVNNAVRCDGQTISLPAGGYNKLYLLVASSEGDRNAVFKVDGREYEARVPYYSGFISQWGWADYTESFVRQGTIAHIGNHRHRMNGQNDSYVFTYLYRIELDIAPGARELILPKDKDVVVFAATASRNGIDDTRLVCEPRALPITAD